LQASSSNETVARIEGMIGVVVYLEKVNLMVVVLVIIRTFSRAAAQLTYFLIR
jgi:hypothetical protein